MNKIIEIDDLKQCRILLQELRKLHVLELNTLSNLVSIPIEDFVRMYNANIILTYMDKTFKDELPKLEEIVDNQVKELGKDVISKMSFRDIILDAILKYQKLKEDEK